MTTTSLQFQLFPDLADDEYAALKEDIARRGVMVAVELDETGAILDGHHRVRICEELGIADYPRTVRRGMTDDQKIEHVLTLNLARRHLTPAQRTELEAKLREMGWSFRRIAARIGVDDRTVERDLAGAAFAAPERIVGADGKSYAAKSPVVRTAKQAAAVSALDPELFEDVAEGKRTVATATQEQHRQERIAAAIERERDGSRVPPGATKLYQTIVVDPPWAYDRADIRGSAEQHYDTLTIEEIAAYPVGDLAAPDAHVYLWVTNPHLPLVWPILTAWGFDYKTMLTWGKPQIGNGHYFRGATEHVLFGVRGDAPIRDQGLSNLILADRTEHSAKPEAFYALVERASYGPIVELFARGEPRDGWDAYGDEVSR